MKVLIAPWSSPEEVDKLRAAFPQVEFLTARGREEIVERIADAEVVFGSVQPETFPAAKQLRWIQSFGAGVEWMARVPGLVESEVVVTNTRGAHAQTIAEHAFAMLLYLTRALEFQAAAQRDHAWRRPDGRVISLSGLTCGVVGLGRIGSAIAQRAHGFDMRVIAVDANDVPRADYVSELWSLDGLPKLLEQSDVVAIAIPITAESRGLIGADQLALMKPSAYLVVVSRGGIVDEAALAAALKEGRLAGAATDVTAVEPLPADSPLWDAPNLLITPHCSGVSKQTTANVWSTFADNLRRYLAGEPLTNLVEKRRGY